mgnify:CR=1 FL=1
MNILVTTDSIDWFSASLSIFLFSYVLRNELFPLSLEPTKFWILFCFGAVYFALTQAYYVE